MRSSWARCIPFNFSDTSRYIDDIIFIIDNPAFAEHIPDKHVYPRELQLNKANTSDKETSFLDLNIKVIGNDIHTSVYDKHDDFGFPIVKFPWLSGDDPRLPSYGIYFSRLVRLTRCCTSVFYFHSKKSVNYFKTIDTWLQISKASENVRKILEVQLGTSVHILCNIVSRNMYLKESLIRYSTVILLYKLRRVKGETNFNSSGSKIVKRI